MKVTKALFKQGTTICATVHSPSAYAFSLFDSLVMLADGQVVYFGPTDDAMVDWFRTDSGVATPELLLNANDYHNAADFLTDLVVGAGTEGRAHEYADAWQRSSIKVQMDQVTDDHMQVRACNWCRCRYVYIYIDLQVERIRNVIEMTLDSVPIRKAHPFSARLHCQWALRSEASHGQLLHLHSMTEHDFKPRQRASSRQFSLVAAPSW
jgi:hypothetical protein